MDEKIKKEIFWWIHFTNYLFTFIVALALSASSDFTVLMVYILVEGVLIAAAMLLNRLEQIKYIILALLLLFIVGITSICTL